MKLGSLREGRDGRLVVVSSDLSRATAVPDVAPTLQAALDDWEACARRLRDVAAKLESGADGRAFDLDTRDLAAPLPRAYQWLDGSAYLHHVELARRARGAELPPELRSDPLMYQGGSDVLLGPRDPLPPAPDSDGLDFEAEIAVITDDVPRGTAASEAARHVVLLTLVNDVSLRGLIPAELAKGFGFLVGKPPSALAPVAVTPDELGDAWDGARVHLPLRVQRGAELFGAPEAGEDMHFGFPELIAHAARTRRLGAGTLIGSGTVSNRDRTRGSACIVERRMLETLEHGAPRTPFLRPGERVRIEMLDREGRSVFGAIEQEVAPG